MTDRSENAGHVECVCAGRPVECVRLDMSAQPERKYPDADPSDADIKRLCDAWTEVGRAILLRRNQKE
jgi:hypothetical protein